MFCHSKRLFIKVSPLRIPAGSAYTARRPVDILRQCWKGFGACNTAPAREGKGKAKPRRDRGIIPKHKTDGCNTSAVVRKREETLREGSQRPTLRLMSSPEDGRTEIETTSVIAMHYDGGGCDEREREEQKGRNSKIH